MHKNRIFRLGMLLLVFWLASCKNGDATKSDIVLEGVTAEDSQRFEKSSVKEFSWQEGLCDYTGYYQSDKYSEKQIDDTYFLVFGYNSVTSSDVDATLDSPANYTVAYIDSSLKKLESNYSEAIKKIQSLEVVPTPFWQEHKELTVLQLRELCQLEKLTLEAHLNPKLLAGTTYSENCKDYVNALTSEDTTVLLATWRKLTDYNKSKNGYPEMVERKYQEQLKSADKLLLARIDLMTYGWWNCANRQRKYVKGFNQEGRMTREFEKLFDRVAESNCEE
ncbi:hypothetical protein H7F15_13905 [Pontibacter sp. Tf4]|uniref:hypothetical protein n=1 Tax=Pontibacter sp. Tf4 TaxID=2761620 RepID=UPI0016236F23|nr:hypothetical protein [Pontibacter sp. Tf4]MBB6612139.1 hypothetical protein [Pontibacter sp. Tf4]